VAYNLKYILYTMEVKKPEEAKIIAFLLTDGGITKTHFNRPKSWRLHFTSKEEFLLAEFKKNIQAMFGKQTFWESYPKRGKSVYLNSSEIAEYFFRYSPTYRTKQCGSYPSCPKLRGQKYGPCKECNPIEFNRLQYPPIEVPKLEQGKKEVFLKYYFSVEGSVTDRIQISQRHPTILLQIQKLLTELRFETALNCYSVKGDRYEWYLRVRKKDMKKFHAQIGFLPVQITGSKRTKQERLNDLIRA